MQLKKRIIIVILLFTAIFTSGCSEGANQNTTDISGPGQVPAARPPSGDKSPSAFLGVSFDAELAVFSDGSFIDTSHANEGYVAASAQAEDKLKFQVIYGDSTYNYDLKNDGTPSFFPLQSGDGTYRFRVMKNVSGNKYAEINSTYCDAVLLDAYQPFLRPSDYVNYKETSECVKKAKEICEGKGTDPERVKAVYDYVCENVTYDRVLALTVQSGYLPDPDKTLASGKGICFDYASLAAAMMRSLGIPTKVIFGYVSPEGLYHAWNMFYTEETGWVTVSWQVDANNWERMDLTFSANGAGDEFIGDGENYRDLFVY